jgi:selenocysteine-specific elongation factor
MSRLIGTAGHVDHGKTALIQALTGIDADRLPEEKRRGMTIDIGFAYMDLPGVGRVSIVDVPGHEKFLTNMLVGALGIDVALLCVAADESVMPQTREHLQILELLPVERVVVALTRADLADAETRAIARSEVDELLGSSRFGITPVVEVSAVTGEGVADLRALLAEVLGGQVAASKGPWYLPIDRAFAVKGHGCVVTGTMAQGVCRIGDRAVLIPGGRELRVRSIHWHGEALQQSEKGKRTAVNLAGVKLEDVRRGQALGEPGALFETSCIDAKVRWIAGPCKHGLRVRVSIGADEAIGRVFLNNAEPDIVQLRLETPVACALHQPLIVRRYSPPDLLAGGRAVVPVAKTRRRTDMADIVEDAATLEDAVLGVLEGKAHGVEVGEVCRILGQTPQSLGDVFEHLRTDGRAVGFGGVWFESTAFSQAADRFMEALMRLHVANPGVAAVPRDKVVDASGLAWSGKPLDRIVAALASTGRLRSTGTALCHADFTVNLSPRQREFLDRTIGVLETAGINTPAPEDLANAMKVPVQAVDEILRLGVEAGDVIRVAAGVYFSPRQVEALKEQIHAIFGEKPFTAAQFRDAVGTTRKYAIPLLEYFDSVRFTTRTGDLRAVNRQV